VAGAVAHSEYCSSWRVLWLVLWLMVSTAARVGRRQCGAYVYPTQPLPGQPLTIDQVALLTKSTSVTYHS
jgi:hypothetical protein